jgi:DNA-directed RNA polymerase specialized sigma24 family protein
MTTEVYGQAYQKGFDRTIRFLLSRGAQRDIAEEAAQTAWTKGWERRAQLRNEGLVLTWVNTIALNVYRGLIRREPLHDVLVQANEPTVSIDFAAMDVARILEFCRPCDRRLLEQQYVSGVTTEEIAREHGVTETAIRIRLLRARRGARSEIERRSGRPRIENAGKAAGTPRKSRNGRVTFLDRVRQTAHQVRLTMHAQQEVA